MKAILKVIGTANDVQEIKVDNFKAINFYDSFVKVESTDGVVNRVFSVDSERFVSIEIKK